MSHRRGWRVAVLSVSALCAVGAQGIGTAQAAPARPSQPSPYSAATVANVPAAMLKAMQRDLGLTAAEAKQSLVNQFETGVTAGKLRLRLGDSFAGSWVTGKTGGTLHVATTNPAAASTITAQGAQAKVVGHSLASLNAAKAKLDRASQRTTPTHSPVWYVDVATNRLTLLSSAPAKARAFVKSAGLSASDVTIKRSDIKPRPLENLRGGDAYYMNNQGRCSIGFPVTQNGRNGFVSAGHCGRAGTSTTGYNRAAQGSFQGSTFPGSDYAWIATNSSWTPTAKVNGYGTVADRDVTGSTVAQQGTQVCRSGSTTGWHCGSVQRLNTSVSYQEGTVYEVTQTNVCAEPGDSGGSFIAGTQAQGMTSGGSGNCRSGGTTFFQPVNEALSVYGLTLFTGGDGGPGPGPGEGTWAAGTVYQVGDVVTYNGASYRCVQGHQALPGWTPENVPALWEQV